MSAENYCSYTLSTLICISLCVITLPLCCLMNVCNVRIAVTMNDGVFIGAQDCFNWDPYESLVMDIWLKQLWCWTEVPSNDRSELNCTIVHLTVTDSWPLALMIFPVVNDCLVCYIISYQYRWVCLSPHRRVHGIKRRLLYASCNPYTVYSLWWFVASVLYLLLLLFYLWYAYAVVWWIVRMDVN